MTNLNKKLRELVDAWEQADDARLAANRAATAATSEAEQAKQLVINELQAQELTAAGGSHIVATLKPKEVPVVTDWQAVYNYISKTQSWELLHKRLGVTAIAERWDNGEAIPGITKTEIFNLKRNKVN